MSKEFSSGVTGFGFILKVMTGLFIARSGFSLLTKILFFSIFISPIGNRQTILNSKERIIDLGLSVLKSLS